MDEKCNILTYLAELRVDIILPLADPLTPPLTDGGLTDVGERCGVFLLTGDLECLGKIFAWFASLLGQPDKLRGGNNKGASINSNWTTSTVRPEAPLLVSRGRYRFFVCHVYIYDREINNLKIQKIEISGN